MQAEVRLAQTQAEIEAAQRLRYQVFVDELGGDGPLVEHDTRLEKDRFDPFFDHLLLLDHERKEADGGPVVGVYRVMRSDQALRAGGFYSESEYDLSALKSSGRRLLELGRSCLHRDYRGGMSMYHLWNGLADYVSQHDIEILFGVASFHGTEIAPLKEALTLLHQNHLAPPDLRVVARETSYQEMDLMRGDTPERKAAMVMVPALIKAYLRLGGFVGKGAWIDHEFNTTDVCLVMDTNRMTTRQKGLYGAKTGARAGRKS